MNTIRTYRTNPVFRRVLGPAPPSTMSNGNVNGVAKTRRPSGRNGNGSNDYASLLARFLDFVKFKIFDATFLICIIIATFVMITLDNKENPVTSFINTVESVEALKPLAIWLTKNITKFVGFIAFMPAILAVSGRKQSVTLLLSVLWIWFIPEHSPYEYLAQGTLLYLFMVAEPNQDKFKFFLIVIGLLCYFFQFGYSTTIDCAKMIKKSSCIRECVWDIVTSKCTAATKPQGAPPGTSK